MLIRTLLITLSLTASLIAEDEARALLIAHAMTRAGTDHAPVELALFGQVMPAAIPVAADSDGVKLSASGRSMRVPWRVIEDAQLVRLAEPTILDADAATQRAFLDALGADARKHPLYLRLTEAVIAADPEAFATRRQAQRAAEAAATAAASAEAGEDARTVVAGANAADEGAGTELDLAADEFGDRPTPDSVRTWDAHLYDKKGKDLKASAYVRYNLALDARSIDHRLGPDGAFYGTDQRTDPAVHMPFADGDYLYKDRGDTKPVDWTGMGGQVAYVPRDKGDPGLGRIRFAWGNHQDHGGAHLWHEYFLAPTYEEWWAKRIDPGIQQPSWNAAGQLTRPVAIGRAHVSWSNCGIQAFANGVLGASGYSNNDDTYPCTRLPPGHIPSAIAISPNNEFGFVTTWGTKDQVGRLWVITMEARTLTAASSPYAGLPNAAGYTRIKVLGSVELPFACPTGVAATSNHAQWKWATPLSQEKLDDPAVRANWRDAGDDFHTYSTEAFAVVISRIESKACVVDLSPLYRAYAKAYFHDYDPARINDEGPRPEQWPPTFDTMPEASPRVARPIRIPQPTAVQCGFDTPKSMANAVFIGTMSGKLAILRQEDGALKPEASLDVGRNVTSIDLGRNMSPWHRTTIVVVSRGDRQVAVIEHAGLPDRARIKMMIRDERLHDPVDVQGWESRGAWGITVADFKGQQLVNYLIEPINAWGDDIFPGFAGDTGLPYERCGILPIAGAPYMLSGAEVN